MPLARNTPSASFETPATAKRLSKPAPSWIEVMPALSSVSPFRIEIDDDEGSSVARQLLRGPILQLPASMHWLRNVGAAQGDDVGNPAALAPVRAKIERRRGRDVHAGKQRDDNRERQRRKWSDRQQLPSHVLN